MFRYQEALSSYDQAIQIKPNYADAYYNKGNAFLELFRYQEAVSSYDQAIRVNPRYVGAYNNKGNVLQKLGYYDEALSSFEKIIEIEPNYPLTIGKILHAKMFNCDWDDFFKKCNEIKEGLIKKNIILQPFTLLSTIDDAKLHKIAAEDYTKKFYPQKKEESKKIFNYKNHSKPRIGYFSSDFHDHAVMHLMMDVFKNQSHQLFDYYAFSFGPNLNDLWRDEVRKYFKQFIIVTDKSDKDIINLARTLEIDIAVDLKGFTVDSRTKIFSHRVAPIQINYLGYPGTMGADYMDYIIADEVVIPKNFQENFTEKILYLPNCYQANMKNRLISSKIFERSDFDLPEKAFVFCNFNSIYKITPYMFNIWMEILKEVPNSVLWLLTSSEKASKKIQMEAKIRGIDEKRIIFANNLPVEEHLMRICVADLFLDTFPYNAHTTASDSIRMGLPILTMAGESFASRVAASILTTVGMMELITNNINDYKKIAIELATQPNKLNEIKTRLKFSVEKSSLFDSKKFTKDLENIYYNLFK